MSTFGRIIWEARKKKRITLRELAGWTKISASVLSETEHGRRLPPENEPSIIALAKILDLNPQTLKELSEKERLISKSDLPKKLFRVDPELAWSFCRVVDEMPERDLEKFLKELLERYSDQNKEDFA